MKPFTDMLRVIGLLLVFSLFFAGCDRHASADNAAAAPLPYAENVAGDGTVIGHVTLVGDFPPLPALDTSATPDSARLHPGGIADESLIVGSNNAVQSVVVSVEGAPPSDGAHSPAAVFDQVNCQYVPHLVAVQTGQPLAISNHDPFAHNVNTLSAANPPMNLSFPGPGEQTVIFASPEVFKVRCDVHPSMSAWIAVLPNSYFAVTGKDGSFVIHHVPAGAFSLAAWQERLGTMRQPLFIKPGETVKLDFVYKP